MCDFFVKFYYVFLLEKKNTPKQLCKGMLMSKNIDLGNKVWRTIV